MPKDIHPDTPDNKTRYGTAQDALDALDAPTQSTGRKFDQGKPKYSLLPVQPLLEVVHVLTFGANKYGDNNWMMVPNAKQRYTDAAMRHLEAWRSGYVTDAESGLHHLAHAICCLLFLIWFDMKSLITK